MTTPDRPLRLDLSFEVPGTPEQVWDAIATANGMSAWFIPSDVEERAGGAVVFHMGETSSRGHITDWDPPRRIAYEEPDWASLVGQEGAEVTPLATEFLVEATSGGTCVVRVVSSAFGTGADWEREFFDDMERGWAPAFDTLRHYLVHFPGQKVTTMWVDAQVEMSLSDAWAALRAGLGVHELGPIEIRDLKGEVERIGTEELLVRLTEPVPGFLRFASYNMGEKTLLNVNGQIFSDDAPSFVERERPIWTEWLQSLGSKTA